MPSRRAQSMPPAAAAAAAFGDVERLPSKHTRGRCVSAICVSWKVFTCIFSHVLLVTVVVGYCMLGAKMFEYLEQTNEIEVKKSISFIRGNLTEGIWQMTYSQPVLYEQNWTLTVMGKLQAFETDLLNSMKVKGWDGNEDTEKLQWTFMGALFYSIIVITTIGYGHISPKTFVGKIATIFYAILGIPLMLLCLSNIGDIMASSFRFIYWRVCCFVCTREPRRPMSKRAMTQRRIGAPPSQPMNFALTPAAYHHYQQMEQLQAHSIHASPLQQPQQQRLSAKSNPSMRRSIRISQRTTDSGLGNSYHESGAAAAAANMQHAYSDTELRYSDQRTWDRHNGGAGRTAGGKNAHQRANQRAAINREQSRDRYTVERDRNVSRPPDDGQPSAMNRRRSMIPNRYYGRSQSMAPDALRQADGTMTLPASYGRNKAPSRARASVRAQSLDPRDRHNSRTSVPISNIGTAFDDGDCKAPVFCNKYAIEELDGSSGGARQQHQQQHHRSRAVAGQSQPPTTTTTLSNKQHQQRCQSMPRQTSTSNTTAHQQHHNNNNNHAMRYGRQSAPKGIENHHRYLDVSMPNDDYYQQKQQHHVYSTENRLHPHRQPYYRDAHSVDVDFEDDDDDDDDDVDEIDKAVDSQHGPNHDDEFDDDLGEYVDERHRRRRRQRQAQHHLAHQRNNTGEMLGNVGDIEMHPIRKHHRRRERQGPPPPPSPRIMTPMGFAIHRQARLQSSAYYADDDSQYGADAAMYDDAAVPAWDTVVDHPGGSIRVRPVPIWLCVFLVVSYIIAGAFMFSSTEGWSFLDSAYFCFITLTTIGFGDFVPAQGVKENPELAIAFCSLYLLFGIALLAMSFNLVQEEVIANVKNVARQLGILKEEEVYY